ncbi:MAG TPA: glycosyltransferase family 4 protein [Puia sp.]
MRLAIISSHPIQYNAPWFRMLAESARIHPIVFYTWGQSAEGAKYDPDFGRRIEWDIPLLDGYECRFVKNTAADPGTHHFKGIINPGLIREIQDCKPDAILVFGWSFHSHLQCIRHFHGKIPVLFRGDSTLLDEQPGIKKLMRRTFLKWVYRHIDLALYVGSNNKDYFLAHGLKEDQLVFAPHAVDNDRFAEPDEIYSQQAKDWRSRLGIGEDEWVLLFAGKLEPKKNPAFLLELARNIDNPKLRILMVGNGILEDELKKAAKDDERILFLDFQNQQQMPVVYRLGHIFVLPSSGPGETWGLAVNEAMACGRPVLVSDKAGCAVDLVRENENGFVLTGNNLQECVKFISRSLENRDDLPGMSRNSRKIIQEFSFRRIIDALENIF